MAQGDPRSAKLTPSRRTDELPLRVRRLVLAPVPRGNLPASVDSFLGRHEERVAVNSLLADSRLVTLTGPPGIGKSRLGLELARESAGKLYDVAWLVELAPVGEEALVPKAVAAALAVQEVPGESVTSTVVSRLRRHRALLLLDNCEHVIEACAELVEALLRGCPDLRILATSREPLSTAGEHVWRVPALAVPGESGSTPPRQLMNCEAVSLFVERARAVEPGFDLRTHVVSDVAEITRRLDGIPLAIELAAGRVGSLTPGEIAERLDNRFRLLTHGRRSRVSHHQTLEAAVDWSHELLSAAERNVLRRAGVFVGGFCLEAAEGVCAGADVPEEGVLDALGQLVAKSLVVADTANARGRYHLLETMRAYALDRLEEAGETTVTRDAHARFYLALVERAEPELTGPRQEEWFERLDGERENLRSAIEWSVVRGEVERALRLVGAVAIFWRVRGHFSEGRGLAEAALAASDGTSPGAEAKALWATGFMALMANDYASAVPTLERSLEIFVELGDRLGQARALLMLGNSRVFDPDRRWQGLLAESAELAREAGDPWCLSLARFVAGYAFARWNELPAARPLLEESLHVAREASEKQGLRAALIGLGKVRVRQGDYAAAEVLLAEALQIADELGEDYGRATVLENCAELALGRGEYGLARELLDEIFALSEAGPVAGLFGPLVLRGTLAYGIGDLDEARRCFEDAIANAGSLVLTRPLHGLGQIAAELGERDRARLLFEQALESARTGGEDKAAAAAALHGLADLARAAGDLKRAAARHNEALVLRHEIGAVPGVVASLDAVAGLAVAEGRYARGASLFGAADALRWHGGYARTPPEAARYEADLQNAGESLTGDDFDAARARGAELSADEAARDAMMRRRQTLSASGWDSLTAAEQKVAALAAEGLTNRGIAERLFITPATVKNHLAHIYSKLGVARRGQLWTAHPGAEPSASRVPDTARGR